MKDKLPQKLAVFVLQIGRDKRYERMDSDTLVLLVCKARYFARRLFEAKTPRSRKHFHDKLKKTLDRFNYVGTSGTKSLYSTFDHSVHYLTWRIHCESGKVYHYVLAGLRPVD